jgi:type II secretory pathway pseudopilin PulG
MTNYPDAHERNAQTGGFTLVEVLLAMIIIMVSATSVLMWQKTSWSQTSSTNRLMVAGHIVDKQIEQKRMFIAQNPVANFAAFKAGFVGRDSIIVDNSLSPPISVRWHAYDTLTDPRDSLIHDKQNNRNVVRVVLTAWWPGAKPGDSLQLDTRIAKNF